MEARDGTGLRTGDSVLRTEDSVLRTEDSVLRTAGDADATGPQSVSLAKTVEVVSTLTDEQDEDDENAADLLKLCHDVLAPLIAADGGVMYLVKAGGDDVHIHLTGTCAGCPGASLTRDGVIAPAVRTVKPKARVVVTTGYRVPDGAKKIT